MMAPSVIGFVGFGEAASVFSKRLTERNAEVVAFDIDESKVNAPGVSCLPLAELAVRAGYVLSTVTTQVAREVASEIASHLRPGRVFVDLNSTSPSVKVEIGRAISRSGADFVEGAILGAVGASGADTRILTGGNRGREVAETLRQLGLRVSFFSSEIGKAATFKMLRSIFSKGLEAIILELLIVGKRAGIDFDPRRKYPLILIVHGGPAWYKKNDWRPYWEQQPIQAYAAEGYVLVFPNFRGSVHFGVDLRLANYGELGHGDCRDCMAAVDHLIAQGFIDQERLGIAGWSYGGYLVPAIITQTDRFRAAQFGASITSMESMYARLSTVEFILDANIGVWPWEDIDTMVKFSSLYSAAQVKTPTLIQHGEDDPRCPVGASILFYKALKFYKVPVVLELYPKEGHGIRSPLLLRRCLRRNLEWFNKWLKGDAATSFEKLFPGGD